MYSLLALINFFAAKPSGSRRIAQGIAYGPSPRQRLDIYAPSTGQGPWPVIYFLSGGAWQMGERTYYEFVGRTLAALGFVVVIPDYRALPEVEYPVFLEDCTEGFAWVVDHITTHGGNPRDIALVGHSAGAYNAVMLALSPRYLRARGLLKNVTGVAGLSGPYDFYPFAVPITLRTFGGVADPLATQPLTFVTEDAPPMFLGTGALDKLVYPKNTVALAAGLRAKGVAVTEIIYEELGHPGTLLALGGPTTHRAKVLENLKAFLLRGRQLSAGTAPF